MSSRKELFFARVRPLASALRAGALRARAGAEVDLSAEAAGFGAGISLSCTPCFINRRHLGLKEQFSTDQKPPFFPKGLHETLLIYRGQTANRWLSGESERYEELQCFKAKPTTSPP